MISIKMTSPNEQGVAAPMDKQKSPAAMATLVEALSVLPLPPTTKWPTGVWDKEVIRHGTMSVSLFAPRGEDHQTPHAQDELYIVVQGSAVLNVTSGEGLLFQALPGSVLFVPATVAHRFENLSDDFASWVIFWGPTGGEAPDATR